MPGIIDHSKIISSDIPEKGSAIIEELSNQIKKKIDILIAELRVKGKEVSAALIDADSLRKQTSLAEGVDRVKKAKQELTAIEKERARVLQNMEKLEAKVSTSTYGSYNRLRAELDLTMAKLKAYGSTMAYSEQTKAKLSKRAEELRGRIGALNKEYGISQGLTKSFNSSMQGMVGTLKNLAAQYLSIYSAIALGKEIFTKTKELDSLAYSFKVLIKDETELASTQAYLSKISEDFGLNILSTSQSYLKFRASIAAANFDLNEAQKLFTSVSKAGSVLGLNTQRMELIFLALEQMISKGSISSEELRRQLGDNLPGAMQIMATALGVTQVQLMKMLKANEVLATDALPKFRVELEKAYGIETVTKIDNVQAAVGRLQTSWVEFVKSIKASEGFTNVLKNLEGIFNRLRFEINPEEFINNESLVEAKGLYDDIIKKLTTVKDKEEIRGKIIKEIQLAYLKQKEYAKELLPLEDKRLGQLSLKEEKSLMYWKANHEAMIVLQKELNKLLTSSADFDKIFNKPKSDTTPQIGLITELEEKIKGLDEKIKASRNKNQIIDYQKEKAAMQDLLSYYNKLFFDPENIEDLKKRYEEVTKAISAAKILGWSPERIRDIEKEAETIKKLAASYENLFGILKLETREDIILPKETFKKYGRDWVQSIDSINKNIASTQKELDEAETEEQRKRLKKRLEILQFELKEAVGELSVLDKILIKVGIDKESIDKTKDALNELYSALRDLAASWTDYLVDKARREAELRSESVDNLKSGLEEERKAQLAGQANSYDALLSKIATEEKLRNEALVKYKKAQRQQAYIDTAMQQSQMALAVAELFASGAKLGWAGVISAIAASIYMTSSFISLKARLNAINDDTQNFAEGTERVQGPGTETSDSVKTNLSKNERVVKASDNRKIGFDFPNDKLVDAVNLYKLNFSHNLSNSNYQRYDSTGEMLSELRGSKKISERMMKHFEDTPTALELSDGRVMLQWGKYNTKIIKLNKLK